MLLLIIKMYNLSFPEQMYYSENNVEGKPCAINGLTCPLCVRVGSSVTVGSPH